MTVRQNHSANRVNRLADPTGATMRAVRIHRFGPPDVLVTDVIPRPTAGPGDLLVRVTAAGVNPADWKIRSDGGARVALPFTVGVGEGLTGWSTGTPVYASTQLHGGGYAEYVALPAEWVAPAPATVDLVAAASLPLAGLTAWQTYEHGGLTAARAHELSAGGHTRGKIVLAVAS